jgi:sarcosine oxidase
MMNEVYDVIVVGIGSMGSAATYELARRGKNVLGLEQHSIPNSQGSHHGSNRIIRLAYFEHPSYIPLLQRSYELWRELEEAESKTGMLQGKLLHITGSLDCGPNDGTCVSNSAASCRQHNIPHEVLTGKQVRERFPGYQLPDDYSACWQADGGFLDTNKCISSFVAAAQRLGATVHAHQQVLDWTISKDAQGQQVVTVHTRKGVFRARKLCLTAGAWGDKLVREMKPHLTVERQVLGWFQPVQPADEQAFMPAQFPVFNLETPSGHYYGFPIYDVPGVKIGKFNHLYERIDPDNKNAKAATDTDEKVLREAMTDFFPKADGSLMGMHACMFTNTADEHFVVDFHPDHDQSVVMAFGFSGHGFKFASVIGEILADLCVKGSTQHDIAFFNYARLAKLRISPPAKLHGNHIASKL